MPNAECPHFRVRTGYKPTQTLIKKQTKKNKQKTRKKEKKIEQEKQITGYPVFTCDSDLHGTEVK